MRHHPPLPSHRLYFSNLSTSTDQNVRVFNEWCRQEATMPLPFTGNLARLRTCQNSVMNAVMASCIDPKYTREYGPNMFGQTYHPV